MKSEWHRIGGIENVSISVISMLTRKSIIKRYGDEEHRAYQ